MTDIHHFIEWNRRQGHKILQTQSTYWVSAGMGTYQAIPYHAVISPSEEELQTLFAEHKATALRYSTPLDAAEGMLSYHIVYEGKNYPPKKLPHKAKKGLAIATIQPISLSQMAAEGWKLRRDTLARQGRTGAETQQWWEKLCLSGKDIEGLEAWGAIVDGRLAAALPIFPLWARATKLRSVFMSMGWPSPAEYRQKIVGCPGLSVHDLETVCFQIVNRQRWRGR